jgi:signal transduction histidine kinase
MSAMFIFTWLFISIINLLLGSFVYIKNKKEILNIAWGLFSLSLTICAFGFFMAFIVQNKSEAIFWIRFLNIGAISIPVFFLHFVYGFLDITNKTKKRLLVATYIITLLFIISDFTRLYIEDVTPKLGFRYWLKPGILYPLFIIFFLSCISYAHYLMVRAYRSALAHKRNKIKYMFLGSFIAFIGGLTTFPLAFNIKIYPFGTYLIALYPIIVSYAIVRHQLMEIEVIIKKTVVFAGMFTFVLGVVVAVAMLVAQLLGGANTLLSLAISALIITFTLRPLEIWLVNTTDKFLFQKKYAYKEILKAFIDEVITVLNLDEVVSSTLKLLDQTLHPYTSAIFILNKVEDKYQLYSSQGLEAKDIVFTSESRLITFLKNTKDPAVIKQIDGIIGVSPEIAGEMARLKATIVLPLILHSDLIGFISLGKKKSDEEYTKDDLDVLLDLARTESVAVGNAQLITEAAQSERRAAIGTMAAGIHHEIGNPLNIMSTKIQIFKLARQKGLLQNKSNEEILNEAEAALDECLKQSGRISEITKKLSNFAKPSKEFKPQLVSIPNEIDETLAVVGHDLELERLKIEKKFPLDLFKILADRQEIQQIFFNLIRNAGQAIEGTGIITISAVNTTNNKVRIEIQDTGKGILEDKINRIFEPFFTTKGPKGGTGLGLSIVRQLVWRNKGEISFMSQQGAGTTFILEFPKGE